MSLPSQSPRAAATGRAQMRTHRRRGLRFPPLGIAAIVVGVALMAGWWLTRGSDEPTEGPLGPNAANAGDQVLADPYSNTPDPTPRRRPAQQPTTDPALMISQGNASARETRESGFDTPLRLDLDETSSLGESLNQTPSIGGGERQEAPAKSASTPAPTSAFDRAITAAEQRLADRDPVAARSVLNDAFGLRGLNESQRSQLRARLTEINQALVFSATVAEGDPLTDTYEIVRGDLLSTIPNKLGLGVDWRLLQRINAIPDPNKIRLGQRIKIVRGPFHVVVDKSDYRLDLYAGPPEQEGEWTYIRSFRVGLGEQDSTPTGSFVVRRDSKLINPHWVNPRTGERFDQNDPENPIGERWIGIDGLGEDAVKTGYGIHGTIDPGSIGQQKSMGCVRMLDDDVELVYEVLVEGISRVRIQN